MATIIFNGKSYNSLEEMPEKERKAYDQMMDIFADKNGNGIPDFMEGDMVASTSAPYSTSPKPNTAGSIPRQILKAMMPSVNPRPLVREPEPPTSY